jgi:translocation and assembly module TamA
VVALRATAATVQGEGALGIPPDQRIYAGGSDTIRGYKYQIVGPQFPDRNPVGGSQLAAATVELRQHIWGDFGMATFADAGEVTGTTPAVNGVKGADTSGKLAVGAGVGVRYATPIGPVRVDIALPLVKFPGNDSLEFYIGIGETF